jgi:hypothetical protein
MFDARITQQEVAINIGMREMTRRMGRKEE